MLAVGAGIGKHLTDYIHPFYSAENTAYSEAVNT